MQGANCPNHNNSTLIITQPAQRELSYIQPYSADPVYYGQPSFGYGQQPAYFGEQVGYGGNQQVCITSG